MKIAVLTYKFPCLSETFILHQITGLLDMGHDVRIFAFSPANDSKVHPDFDKYDLADRTCYIPSAPGNKFLCMVMALGLVVLNLPRSPGNMLRCLKMFILRKKGLSLKRLYLLLEFIKGRFDIVQCHYGTLGIVGAFLKDGGIRARVCTAFHGFDISSYLVTHGDNAYDELFQKGDLFLPTSEHWKNRLLELNCPADRIIVHQMGVDLQRFEYSERTVAEGETVRILMVGRLTEKKGHEYAIRAVAKLIDRGKKVELLIAGGGVLKDSLMSLTSQLHVEDHVKFSGSVDQDEVIGLYARAHLFLLPSVTAADGDMESAPVVLKEACAMGLPVVSTLHSGIGEVVVDGKSGFLVPERDADALVDRLGYLIDNPDIWPQMGRCGRQFIEDHFNIEKLSGELSGIFDSLIENTRN